MFQHGLFLGVKKSLGHAHIGLLGLIQKFRRKSPPLSNAKSPPGVQPGSQNPDPILDQKMSFPTLVFGPGGGNKTQHYMFT